MLHASRRFHRTVLPWGLALAALLAMAPAQAEPGADHPELARYPDAVIDSYDFKEYEEFQLILSKPVNRNSAWTADKLLPLEGRVTYIHYKVPASASPLQVFRNYQSSLKRSGFTPMFTCERPCTEANLDSFKMLMKVPKHYLNYSTDNQFLAAQRGSTYVSLWVNDGGVWLHVVEKQALDDGLMGVTGESPIAKALNASGKVDVYGFQFDTGKAVLKEGSKATLQELGRVLQDNPTLTIEVVGHTDDVGGADANQKLSEARATAVTEALAQGSAIDPGRMTPRGQGQGAPVAPNTTEANRAKNRRVEIVASMPPAAPVTPVATAPAKKSRTETARPATTPEAAVPPPAAPAPEPKTGGLMEDAGKAIDTARKLKGLFGL